MKKGISTILLLIMSSFSFASGSVLPTNFACGSALPTNNVNFCSSFEKVAPCYCTSSGLPSGMCQDMDALYKRMIAVFGTLKKACEYQKYTSTQDCVDNWTCYRFGGVDSRGRWCSSNKSACK